MSADGHIRELVERAPIVAFIKDADGRYLYANDAWLTLLGLERTQVLGRLDDEVFSPELARSYMANDRRVLEDGVAIEVEEEAIVAGEPRVFLSTKFPIASGSGRALCGFSIDITDRVTARAALVRSEARYRKLVEHSPDAYMVLDPQKGSFVEANANALRLFDMTEADFMRVGPADLSPAVQADGRPSAELAMGNIQAVMSGETPVFDWLHLSSRGELIPCRIWLARVELDQGYGVRATLVDLREANHAKEALARARAERDQARRLESLGRLAGGIAHDFNNLLTVIVNSAEFLGPAVSEQPAARADLDVLVAAAQRARTLTAQLLNFAREQTGDPVPVLVDEAISDSQKLLRTLFGADVQLTIELSAPGVRIWAQPGQLEQAIMNVAVNARDALVIGGASAQGEVTITTALCAGEPTRIEIVVRDSGVGMSGEVLEKAFDPFFTTKTVGKGAGLGLSAVHGIVTGAGGSVGIESAPGGGTTITMAFPIVVDTPESARDEPAAIVRAGGRGHVLLVEDELAVRRIVARALERAGFDVISAGSPDEALAFAPGLKGQLTAIVSDIVMPKMNGLELVERLRPLLGPVPVLFISGYSVEALDARGLSQKDIELLPKPFTPRDLSARLDRLLAGH